MRQNNSRVTELESTNKTLMMTKEELNVKVNELMKSSEQNKPAAEKEITAKCAKFGIELVTKIQEMNEVIKGRLEHLIT